MKDGKGSGSSLLKPAAQQSSNNACTTTTTANTAKTPTLGSVASLDLSDQHPTPSPNSDDKKKKKKKVIHSCQKRRV